MYILPQSSDLFTKSQGRIKTFEKGRHKERKGSRSQEGGLGSAAPPKAMGCFILRSAKCEHLECT